MVFEEAKMEFVPVEMKDIITSSTGDPSGPEIHICGGELFDGDCVKAGSL